MPQIFLSDNLISMSRIIFSQLAYTPISLDLSNKQLEDLFAFCGIDLSLSTMLLPLKSETALSISVLSLHNYPLKTITNIIHTFPMVRELIISIYTPYFYDILVLLAENRQNLSHLKEFKIINNKITQKEIKQLTILLENLNQLSVLVLDNCGLYDYDIYILLPAISWDTITHLSLNRNKLTTRALEGILTLVRDKRKCAPPSLFLQDMDAESTDATIRALRLFTNSSTRYTAHSLFRNFWLSCKQNLLKQTWFIDRRDIYVDLSYFEISDAIAPDLGLFIYEWLRLSTICYKGVSEATICLKGRVTSSICGTSNALSIYGLYLLFHRDFNTLGLSISLDCSNCNLEFNPQKLQLPVNAISRLMNRLKTNLAASLVALSLSDCDLAERWKRQDIHDFISFLYHCKRLRRLDLRYNEFNSEFNAMLCNSLEDIEFLPLLNTLEADMLIDLSALSISLKRRYSEYMMKYLREGDAALKGLIPGPTVLSCGSQSRGNKVPGALMNILSFDRDLVLYACMQSEKLKPSLFENYVTTLQKIFGEMHYSPLKSITLRQSISSGSLAKPIKISLWHYKDYTPLRDMLINMDKDTTKSALMEDGTYCTTLFEQATALTRAEIARTSASYCTHSSSEACIQEKTHNALTLKLFLELVSKKCLATFVPQLLHIDFSHNSLKTVDIQELMDMIPHNSALQALILSDCSLSDKICASILDGLPNLLKCTNLWYIDISENMFGRLTEHALSIFLQKYYMTIRRQIVLNLRLRPGNTFSYEPEILISSIDRVVRTIERNIFIWLIMSKDSISSFSSQCIRALKQRGINVISVVSPTGRFYDHKYHSAVSYLFKDLNLPTHSFCWNLMTNIYEHFMHGCA